MPLHACRSIKAKKRKGGGLGAINEDGADKNDHGNDDLGDGDLNVDLGLTGWNDGDGVDADNPLQARRDQHSANANSGGDGCAISYTGVSQHIPSYTSTLPNGRLIASLVEHMPSPHIHLAHRLITFITLAPPSFFSPLLHAYINGTIRIHMHAYLCMYILSYIAMKCPL